MEEFKQGLLEGFQVFKVGSAGFPAVYSVYKASKEFGSVELELVLLEQLLKQSVLFSVVRVWRRVGQVL